MRTQQTHHAATVAQTQTFVLNILCMTYFLTSITRAAASIRVLEYYSSIKLLD